MMAVGHLTALDLKNVTSGWLAVLRVGQTARKLARSALRDGSCNFEQLARQSPSQALWLPAGEVHLETIIKDLRERFARIELQVSPPLVAFRESVFNQAELPEAIGKPPKVCSARSHAWRHPSTGCYV